MLQASLKVHKADKEPVWFMFLRCVLLEKGCGETGFAPADVRAGAVFAAKEPLCPLAEFEERGSKMGVDGAGYPVAWRELFVGGRAAVIHSVDFLYPTLSFKCDPGFCQ